MPNQQQSVEATLAERGSRYGKFSDHARLAQDLQQALHAYSVVKTLPVKECTIHPWQCLPPVHAQALTVICDKIARVMSGDCNYLDNWHDIQGYAKLVEDYIKQQCVNGLAGIEADSEQAQQAEQKQEQVPTAFREGDHVQVRDYENETWQDAVFLRRLGFFSYEVLLKDSYTINNFSYCRKQEQVAPQESFKAGETVMVRDSDDHKWQYAVYIVYVGTGLCDYPHITKTHGGSAPTGRKQCKRAD